MKRESCYYLEERTQAVNQLMKRRSVSLVIRVIKEIQRSKNTYDTVLKLIQGAIRERNKSEHTNCWWGYEAILTHILCWWESKLLKPFWRTVAISGKVEDTQTLLPSNPTPESVHKKVHKSTVCNCSLFVSNWKYSYYSLVEGMDQLTAVCSHSAILHSTKHEWTRASLAECGELQKIVHNVTSFIQV